MKLYHSPTTPFGRKVMVHLIETGQAKDVTVIAVAGTPTSPGTMPVDQNPLGKIPALVLDDGTAIYDSRVITRYLDDRSGGRLYPPAPGLWKTLFGMNGLTSQQSASLSLKHKFHCLEAPSTHGGFRRARS